jgi:hypothetical protein
MAQVVVPERVIRRAPLGLRFLDLARGTPVTHALSVTARPVGATRPVVLAERSPLSGIFGFRALPGLRAYEVGERPATDWCGSPPDVGPTPLDALAEPDTLRELVGAGAPVSPVNFAVRVVDRLGRFLGLSLALCLPRERLLEAPLFSAPSRPVLPGQGVVRGQIVRRAGGGPASWAFVTAGTEDGTYAAVADARGMFVLFVPYASALPPLLGSPPHGTGPIDQLTWPLIVQVFYEPAVQRPVPGLGAEDPPDIRSIFEQRLAIVFDTVVASGPSVVRPIRLGEELVVATEGDARLLVDPV